MYLLAHVKNALLVVSVLDDVWYRLVVW